MKPASFVSPKRIDHNGAPIIYANTINPERNIDVIYEAIQSMPDDTIMRGDRDPAGRSYVYFRCPSKNENEDKNLIEVNNVRYYRREAQKIMTASVNAMYNKSNIYSKLKNKESVEEFRNYAEDFTLQKDFTVKELKIL